MNEPLVGVRHVDPNAWPLLAGTLRPVVIKAIAIVKTVFEHADIDVEHFTDPDSDGAPEQLRVAVYTTDGNRLERVRTASRRLRTEAPQSEPTFVTITVHGV